MKTLLCMLLVLLLSGCTGMTHSTSIKEYSNHPPKIYTLQQWQALGFDVWKECYDSKRWDVICQNNSIISDYRYRTELKINEFLSKARKEDILVDTMKVQIAVELLAEKMLPVQRWFWFPRKERVLIGSYEVMYNDSCLGSAVVYLPATE